MMNLLLGLNSCAYIFLKAFQQKNVIHDKYHWMIPISILMGFSEVFVIVTIIDHVTMFTGFAIGLGGGIGCIIACLKALEFANYKEDFYPLLALPEEVGEFLGKIAKAARGDEKYQDEDVLKAACQKELGDILWQLNACCYTMETTLEEVAEQNLEKLAGRLERGTIQGDGDDR